MTDKNMTDILVSTRSSMPSLEEYTNEIKILWESHWLSNNGLLVQKFKQQMKDYLGVENLELLVNGHLSLETALAGMNLTGEVITTPFTFVSTTNAIVRNGLTPVFCDINRDDFNIDVDKIEALITDKTTAIVPVHIYGNPCDVKRIDEIAKKHNLKVVYDAAQAFGVTIDGESIVKYGDASIFSLHAAKVFHTIEGGAIIYKDKSLKDLYEGVPSYATIMDEDRDHIGFNAKMNEFQAAMGICNLRHVDDELDMRRAVYDRYKENFKDIEGIDMVPDKEGVVKSHPYLPVIVHSEKHGANRDEILEKLIEGNVYAGKYFAPLISETPYYKKRFGEQDLPNAKYVEANILALPIFSSMRLEDVDRTCKIIKETAKK